MTAPYLQGTGTVPETTALKLRGLQTDAYGQILGGHKALIDPLQSGLTGKLATGASVPNLVAGAANPVVSFGFTNAGVDPIETAKGLNFTSATNEYGENILLVDYATSPWNLLNHGSEPSLVISTWLTIDALPSGVHGVLGFAAQNGSFAQWGIQLTSAGLQPFVNGVSDVTVFNPPLGDRTLITQYIQRTGAGTFNYKWYVNDALQQTLSRVYPLANPRGAGSPITTAQPRMGQLDGFGGSWDGTIHRQQNLKVDPSVFDIAAWLAAEIAANGARF